VLPELVEVPVGLLASLYGTVSLGALPAPVFHGWLLVGARPVLTVVIPQVGPSPIAGAHRRLACGLLEDGVRLAFAFMLPQASRLDFCGLAASRKVLLRRALLSDGTCFHLRQSVFCTACFGCSRDSVFVPLCFAVEAPGELRQGLGVFMHAPMSLWVQQGTPFFFSKAARMRGACLPWIFAVMSKPCSLRRRSRGLGTRASLFAFAAGWLAFYLALLPVFSLARALLA